MKHFLDDRRLLRGPWQAFERDVARLLMHAGFDDVRVVGGSGDQGADVVGVKNGEIWVVQCKHTTTAPPTKQAVQEVVDSGTYYGAHRMLLATSRAIGGGVEAEFERYRRIGINVELLDPARLAHLSQEVPEYAKSRRELRPYQQEAVSKFREGLTDTGRAQVVLATGLGKTVVMAEVVADLYRDGLIRDNRVLVLADKRELIRQLQFGFWHQLPKWVPTHMLSGDETPSFYDGITFATVQSVINRYVGDGADVRPWRFGHGVWCDHPGQRHREHEGAGRPVRTMSCELALLAGRLCDSPGCAESADP